MSNIVITLYIAFMLFAIILSISAILTINLYVVLIMRNRASILKLEKSYKRHIDSLNAVISSKDVVILAERNLNKALKEMYGHEDEDVFH